MRRIWLALIVILGTSHATMGRAEDQNDKGFVPLFNGKNLEGWKAVNTAPSTWNVKDGLLLCSGKPIGELRTTKMYQNFILEMEWRHMKPKGNARLFLWADDITAKGVPFHRGIEVQILENDYGNNQYHTTHGDIFPIHGAKMTPIGPSRGSRAFPTERRSKPAGQWNHYRVVAQDGNVTLAVNGKVVTQGKECSPKKGYLCLESEGGVVQYRNIRIKELPATSIDKNDIAIADRGYESLYNGVDLTGWKTAGKGWKVQDWVLRYQPPEADVPGEIQTQKSFGDFGFVVDVKLTPKSKGQLQLRGTDKAVIELDLSKSEKWGLVKGWNRLEGKLQGNVLAVSINGGKMVMSSHQGVPDEGPIKIVAQTTLELANIYTRPLKK